MTEPIRLFVTGGTFDKEYNERDGSLFFQDTHVTEMLRKGRCRAPVEVRTLMMIDSLEMTDDDRATILDNCLRCPHEPFSPISSGTQLAAQARRRMRNSHLRSG